jgi:succinyl-diaminopimelate desuccinylase
MLELARLVAARREQLRGELVLHFAIGEERAEPGTRSLLEAGFGADAGIVLEPTSLRVATAQRGGAAVTVEIRGRAAHAGSPERGASALAPLARVLDAVAARNRELSQLRHPALAAATIIPTVIRAGDTANILPDRCEVVLDLRLVPGMSLAAEVQELRRRLPPLVSDTHIEVLAPECHWQASVTPSERSFEGVVRAALADEGATAAASQAYATPFASDVACLINEGSVEAVTFGPGDIAAAHAADEHVDLGEVATASRTIARVIDRTLFVQPDPSPWTAAQAALDS